MENELKKLKWYWPGSVMAGIISEGLYFKVQMYLYNGDIIIYRHLMN